MAKTIESLTWNKEVDGENPKYGFSTSAENVYISKERNFTVRDFFAWVKDFFDKGEFIYTGSSEPQNTQTKVWYDTSQE